MNTADPAAARRFAALLPGETVPPGLVDQLAAAAQHVELSAGAPIFTEGCECPAIAFLLRGSVRVFQSAPSGRQVILYRVRPGQSCVLTTCCVLRNTRFPANASGETEIEALAVPAEVFRSWFEKEPFWRRFVVDLFADRLEHVLGLVDAVVFQRTDERLARFLLARSTAASGRIELTHESIAEEIGTAREVVSRILDRLASLGILRTTRGVVEVLNVAKLGEFADPDALRSL